MKLSNTTVEAIYENILIPISNNKGYYPEYSDIEAIESEIRPDCEILLERFFQSKSDANKYLTATEQEDLENDFKLWVRNLK